MSFASFIEKQLPCMRRYAFAMIGTLEGADSCLANVLSGLIEARRDERPTAQFRKVDLFILLQQSIAEQEPRRVENIMRQLVLLLEVERFSIDKVSLILSLPLDELWHLANSEGYDSERESMIADHNF